MLGLRVLRRLSPVFSPFRTTSQVACGRGSPSASANVAQQQDGVLLKMDNPYEKSPRRCVLCNIAVDFRNVQLLSQFISPFSGRIYGRRITGLCGRKQKEISKAIKKAHSMGFMSVTHKHPQFMKDPRVCGMKHLDN
ncbi:small ribosomal subunit protein bS18m [Aulostomus maculatus]